MILIALVMAACADDKTQMGERFNPFELCDGPDGPIPGCEEMCSLQATEGPSWQPGESMSGTCLGVSLAGTTVNCVPPTSIEGFTGCCSEQHWFSCD